MWNLIFNRNKKQLPNYFSYSQINSYNLCPQQYKLLYIDGIRKKYESYRNKLKVFIWQYTIDNKLIEFQFINDTFGHYKLIIDDFNYINN